MIQITSLAWGSGSSFLQPMSISEQQVYSKSPDHYIHL